MSGPLRNIAKPVQLLLRAIEPPRGLFADDPRPIAIFVMLSVQLFFQFLMLPAMHFVIRQGLHVLLGQRLRMHGHGVRDVVVPGNHLRVRWVVVIGFGRGVDGMRGIHGHLLAGFNNAPHRGPRVKDVPCASIILWMLLDAVVAFPGKIRVNFIAKEVFGLLSGREAAALRLGVFGPVPQILGIKMLIGLAVGLGTFRPVDSASIPEVAR